MNFGLRMRGLGLCCWGVVGGFVFGFGLYLCGWFVGWWGWFVLCVWCAGLWLSACCVVCVGVVFVGGDGLVLGCLWGVFVCAWFVFGGWHGGLSGCPWRGCVAICPGGPPGSCRGVVLVHLLRLCLRDRFRWCVLRWH